MTDSKNMIFLAGVCCFLILILGVYFISNANKEIIKIDGTEKMINPQGKSFKQVCNETRGLWMEKEMRMGELRNGVSASLEKCSGCMPDSKNMFCILEDYIDYIKSNGVKTEELNMKMEER